MDPNATTPEQQEAAGTSGQDSGNQQEFDYERGYNQLRPEYTRVTQELGSTRERLSEYEELFSALQDSDPDVRNEALEALGIELDTGSQHGYDDEFVDPLEEKLHNIESVVEQLRQERELEAQQIEDQELLEMRDNYIDEAIGYIEDSLGVEFSEREEEALGNLAIAMEDEDGVPDVQGAYELLYGEDGVLETNRARWIASKTGAAQPPLGTSIPAEQKPKTKAERVAYIDERMRALEQQL